ncbi:GntR family transcriptional regulator [Caldifermentibacillus hisashii]|uniref:FadR/GntR family transcriptional regulator n=1 Tax=Caldifermentibacillus hisashii TaxID=996558 RepID=UPI0034225298
MGQRQYQQKVYLETFEKIRKIIQERNLQPGDRLPSERELTDLLHVGRSSVREALRAMELLGLIETRRGEGTFIVDFRKHQLVELLSSFVFQRENADHDILEVKRIIETSGIYKLVFNRTYIDISQWNEKYFDREKFFERILILTDNQLLLKIWYILSEFIRLLQFTNPIEKKNYIELLTAINSGNWDQALSIYMLYFDQAKPIQ